MKYIILVGDGMGDFPLESLDGRTPLEAADTPVMDFLAGRGRLFRLQTVPPGFAPGSDVANLSLLGYRPAECYSGRAPLEAASMGVELPPDAIAFRCNLVTLERQDDRQVRMVDYSGGHIDTATAAELIGLLDRELGDDYCRFYPGVSYRHLLVWRRGCAGLQTVPPHDHSDREVGEYWRRYLAVPGLGEVVSRAAQLLAAAPANQRRRENGENPANAIWLWGEGRPPAMATLAEQFGVSGALISAVDLLKGIGVYAGMEIINVPGVTGYLDTNYAGKVAAALEALKRHDLVFVHVEAPDEVSHQGRLDDKLQAISDFDHKVVGPMLEGLQRSGEAFRLVVTMDHFTPLATRTHADLPVPFLLFDSQRDARDPACADGSCWMEPVRGNYSERSAADAELLVDGREFLSLLLGND
ncbi:cofactor-independent phosphoglycerate mutase [Desulfurivibrio alkaliphilus]|uniref:Proposed homoserine kinase n=1 Tax=Desulfurivibrio alkaliphilus (strain DSM 19089 / UNIQEM U267 / AHT2) TaxID=589865 RepID=D6Z213_DESAT|nr:cofactor-independent phosphoglycerate mutase [Desulfurivibrio alkaliphilus]ADH85588.1 proposed homoserine kinase [Desulfurivibrio alkaliphilus AHT 2]